MKKLVIILLLMSQAGLQAQSLTQKEVKEDLHYFLGSIKTEYAYWHKKQTDWQRIEVAAEAAADSIGNRQQFIGLLEQLLYNLYDHHATLNTNTGNSQRLVPSGTDIWAAFRNGNPTITEVRQGSKAAHAGLFPGTQVIAFNGIPIAEAIRPFLPMALTRPDQAAADYALRVLLAGTHSGSRILTVMNNRKIRYVDIGKPNDHGSGQLLDRKLLSGNTGYIRINNSLGNNDLIPAFDTALDSLLFTRSLILDLRETPGGGNSTVARAILGRFISKEGPFQKHILPSEEMEYGVRRSWLELASPRGRTYTGKLVVLTGRWTGSMGEGLAIGFDGLKRATLMGTPMAGLAGAVHFYQLPHSRIGLYLPAEQLQHISGIPREEFQPAILSNPPTNDRIPDPLISKALELILKKTNFYP